MNGCQHQPFQPATGHTDSENYLIVSSKIRGLRVWSARCKISRVDGEQVRKHSTWKAGQLEKGQHLVREELCFPLTRMRLALRMSSAVRVLWVGSTLSSCWGCRWRLWASGSCSRAEGVSCGSGGIGRVVCSGWSSPFRVAGSGSSNCSLGEKWSKSWNDNDQELVPYLDRG